MERSIKLSVLFFESYNQSINSCFQINRHKCQYNEKRLTHFLAVFFHLYCTFFLLITTHFTHFLSTLLLMTWCFHRVVSGMTDTFMFRELFLVGTLLLMTCCVDRVVSGTTDTFRFWDLFLVGKYRVDFQIFAMFSGERRTHRLVTIQYGSLQFLN